MIQADSFRFTDEMAATGAAQAIAPPDAVTLKLAPGATSILQKGSLGVGATDSYVLGAGAGQPLVLNAAGKTGNDPALIVTSLPQGRALLTDSPWHSIWTTVLTKIQDFLVQIENGVSREGPTDHLVFTAREDVDYVVSIVPPAVTVAHYTVTFKVSG